MSAAQRVIPARTGEAAPRAQPSRLAMVAVVALTVGLVIVALLLLASTPYVVDADGWRVSLAADVFGITVGLIGWWARPSNRVGPLLILYGFANAISFLGNSSDSWAWTIGDMWNTAGVVVVANIYLAFPSGRTTGWSRTLVIACYASFLIATVGQRLFRPYPWPAPPANPLLIWSNEALADAIQRLGSAVAVVLVVLVVATVLNRWRVGSPAARRALAPVFWVSPIALVVYGSYFLGHALGSNALIGASTGVLAQVSGFLLPLAFLIGVLRAQLERGSIADLVTELDGASTGELEGALARAVHDPTLRLAFPDPTGAGFVDTAGAPMEAPVDDASRSTTRIVSADRTIAVLVHDPVVDRGLVESAAAASRLALENERLAAQLRAQLEEVRASRRRIVEATDEERQRLERNLHDGAQQRLVALGFTLRRASRGADADPELKRVLADAGRELEEGLGELRALARGLQPIALAGGLPDAIRDLAARSPIPVAVELADVRLPGQVESTAYFIVAEALTNVLRYAKASSVSIRGRLDGDELLLEIVDDGVGGVDELRGTGVRGLADRAAAIGGSLRIGSPLSGAGTSVTARLPIQ